VTSGGTTTPRHLRKRSFALAGHRTSVALESAFWAVLEEAARARGMSLAALVAEVDAGRAGMTAPLASALRVFALGERRAGGGGG
jgi:predicted DNA-binding ribbon-helix-helix protein